MVTSLSPSFSILLVDDEVSFLRSLSLTLERTGRINNILRCEDSREVMGLLAHHDIGLVLLDLTMPHLSGEALLPQIVEHHPEVMVIVVSGLNQVETAVSCLKQGAFDYFVKTVETDRLVSGVERAIRMVELQRENQQMRETFLLDRLAHPEVFKDIITANKGMRSVFQYLEAVAQSNLPILITGESGVGKELFAKAAHHLSGRTGPLVSVNVAGLDDNVFADTLFGHVRGAFTGAREARRGMVEEAADGTLFLDEIGDLSLASQIKLLRLLQEGEYFPLGSDKPKKMKARIIIATHQDLKKRHAAGQFRKDLYYRLRTHQIEIPSLRERKEDIPLLLDHFLDRAAAEFGKKKPTIPKELPVLLATYHFPGNVRELRGMVFDAMSTHKDMMLSMAQFKKGMNVDMAASAPEPSTSIFVPSAQLPPLDMIADVLVQEAMSRAEGNQSIACRILGISQPALSKRLKKMAENTTHL